MNNHDLCLEEITKSRIEHNLMNDLEYFTDLEYFNNIFFNNPEFIIEYATSNYLLTPERVKIMFKSYNKDIDSNQFIDYDYINDNLFFNDNTIIDNLFEQLKEKKDTQILNLLCYAISKHCAFYKIYKETINVPINLNF
jgi:hypothetical protein